ncbi:MAG TPA: PSD1 and planctomycete cytochrome C domain-containing protein [Pirellulales bacterium]|jgi:cytochrome c553
MRFVRALALCLACFSCSLRAASCAEIATPSQEDAERFFETEVRPMLVARCLACHGSEKQEAGLRLDSREALLKGSDAELVVVPGEPDKSPLIHAVRYDGDVKMPPAARLEDKELALLTTWVKMGVPWGGAKVAGAVEDMQARATRAKATHWAYQPIVRPEPPTNVSDPAWTVNPIDRFICAELDRAALRPSSAADRRTLLRRATFDLTGLPATVAEIEAFVNDPAADAFAKAVDGLLASPAYGQRWGRHWMDVARYSDTKGYVFTEDRRYPYAYTYRDYVIRALNEDRPYDEFIRQQLAADQLNVADRRDLAAMGFLTVGRRFSNNIHDIIDDRIDVVTRGVMGLTLTCARCHDHKYDPLPTDDYYSLYGVFASSIEPSDPPLIGEPQESEAYQQFVAELAQREKALNEFRDTKYREMLNELRGRVKDYLCQVVIDTMKDSLPDDADLSFNSDELRPQVVRRWKQYIERTAREPEPVFALWHEFAALPRDKFDEGAKAIVERLRAGSDDPAKPINPVIRSAFVKATVPDSMLDAARVYGDTLVETEKSWLALVQPQPPAAGAEAPKTPERFPDDGAEQLRQVLYAHGAPPAVPVDEARRVFDRATQNELGKLRKSVDEIKVNSPAAPPRAMVLNDAPTPHHPHVFLRGDPARVDREVPRRFVQFLATEPGKPFSQGSGRLELAREITRADNPLTARVMANRVWMHHFGAPLVRTPGDFGLRSEPPTHPALLDYLARSLIDEGWSLKRLHRLIMLSNTYAQASDNRPEGVAADPENRLLWRANRRRLDFEAMRDSLLVSAGRLDGSLEGRSIDIWQQPYSVRRSVYAFVDRQDLPGVFRMFDFASPDVSMPQRPVTTVPQQALFAMNSPFVLEQARHLAARTEVLAATEPAAKIRALYRAALARDAEQDEVQAGVDFVARFGPSPSAPAGTPNGATPADSAPPATVAPVTVPTAAAPVPTDPATPLSPWEQYAQALLMANEFMFID